MTGAELTISSVAALLIGLLIGSVGIGGVLLVPWLTQAIGLPVRDAVAIAMFSFVATGLAAVWAGARSPRDPATTYWPMIVATAPGSLLGAVAIALAPERAALAVLAIAVSLAGARLLWARHRTARCAARSRVAAGLGRRRNRRLRVVAHRHRRRDGAHADAAVARGAGSVRDPARADRAAADRGDRYALGHALGHGVDWVAGAALGAMQVPGVLAGRRLAEGLPVTTITRLLGSSCSRPAPGWPRRHSRRVDPRRTTRPDSAEGGPAGPSLSSAAGPSCTMWPLLMM